jgi:hypothetical protein
MTDRVERISGVIGDPASWKVVEEAGGEMVNVPVAGLRGVTVRMRKAEAVARGLWAEPAAFESKAAAPARNKARRMGANKQRTQKGTGEA